MRIATWNLERRTSVNVVAEQRRVMASVGAAVIVLTEPARHYVQQAGVMCSPQMRGSKRDESWIAIVGPDVQPLDYMIPAQRMAAVAMLKHPEGEVLIYGSVLPWSSIVRHASEHVLEGESATGAFLRLLEEQAADIEALRSQYGRPVIWAGDFNQSLVGPNIGGSVIRRRALASRLESLGLVAWNAEAQHALPKLQAIDLVCGPREMAVTAQGRIDPAPEGVRLSDHAGYWVDV